MTSEQTLLSGQAAQFVFRAPGGSVVTLGGIDGAALRELVDQAEHIPDDRRALFVRLRPAGSVEAYVEQVIAVLAETAMRLWPVWFTDVSFAMCCNNALGRLTYYHGRASCQACRGHTKTRLSVCCSRPPYYWQRHFYSTHSGSNRARAICGD